LIGTDQNGTASPKSPPHFAKVSITSGVMILEVASVIDESSTSTGRSLLARARIRLTSSANQSIFDPNAGIYSLVTVFYASVYEPDTKAGSAYRLR
jgi:hypothetical protein